jgi:hypothetical protein
MRPSPALLEAAAGAELIQVLNSVPWQESRAGTRDEPCGVVPVSTGGVGGPACETAGPAPLYFTIASFIRHRM